MKQLDQHIKDEVVITEDKQVIKQMKFIGSFNPQPGQKVCQLNLVTRDIEEARFDSISISLKNGTRKKLVIKPDCIYTVALNKANAKRKFIRMVTKIITK